MKKIFTSLLLLMAAADYRVVTTSFYANLARNKP